MTHLETLKNYHAWRRGDDERTMDETGLTPKEIGEALDWAIHELDVPDWEGAGEGTSPSAIALWKEALKEKSLRQHYQEQLGTLQTERARSGLALRAALKGLVESHDVTFYDVAGLVDERDELREKLKASEELNIKLRGVLTRIVNITKGQPPENTQHSTHDAVGSVRKLAREHTILLEAFKSVTCLTLGE